MAPSPLKASLRVWRSASSAGFAGATDSWGEVRKGGEAPLRVEKAVGRALAEATRLNPRVVGEVPSTKGSL